MLKKIIEWLASLWGVTEEVAEELTWDDTEYLRTRYGISQPFAEEE